MKRLIFLMLVLSATSTVFSQSRPKTDAGSLQKANKRPPQSIETQAKPENQTKAEVLPVAGENAVDQSAENSTAAGTDDGEVLRVDTNLVTIPVRVSDRGGRFVAGLTKESFKIFEDGAEQEIAYFSNIEEPFTVALVLDMSYSTTFKINEIQAAANAFVGQLHKNDKVMIVSFDEEVHVLCEPTSDREILRSAIKGVQIASGTSLYEAVDLVVNQRLRKIQGRKAVVLFTDGVDTTSRKVFSTDNLRDVEELDSLVYPIEYDTYNDVQNIKNNPSGARIPGTSPIPGGGNPFPFPFPGAGNPSPSTLPRTGGSSPFPFPMPTTGGVPSGQGTSAEDYRKAEEYLQELANRTSGRVYKASTTANLSQAFTNIAAELRQIYSLGFYPSEEKAGRRRQLKVRVNQPGTSVRARDSYVVGEKQKKKK